MKYYIKQEITIISTEILCLFSFMFIVSGRDDKKHQGNDYFKGGEFMMRIA
jgi:hypothetical protein